MIGDNESQAATLCKYCGLCCTGHLFIWAKLKPSELDPAEKLGMHVFRSDPSQRGFSHPCPLWKGQCTIYTTSNYPRVCRAYRCKLLKELIAENIALSAAQEIVDQAKQMIHELEPRLPVSPVVNFRERLVAYIEQPDVNPNRINSYLEFREDADKLLHFIGENFGVTDFLE